MFRFYKGEENNPFDSIKQNAAFQFWGYEQMFESKFNENDFSAKAWIPANATDYKEWGKILAYIPIDKEELFKIWLFNIIMVHLPEKYQSNDDHFLRLYWDTKI